MCCMRLAGNAQPKNDAKNRHLRHRSTLSGYVFATKARIDNRKNLLSSNVSSRCPHNMANVGPLTDEIGLPVLTDFAYWLRYCSDVAHRRPTKLCTIFGRLLDCYTVYTFLGAFAPPLTEFCQVQNSVCVQVLRFPILAASLHATRAGVSQTLRR